ncbi:MAG TPA: ABC transporter permease, partial [Aestuariivirgaceae bacterium]
METRSQRLRHGLIAVWTLALLLFVYLPIICITLASLTASRYFQFPITRWGLDWWAKTFSSIEIRQLLTTSVTIALCV